MNVLSNYISYFIDSIDYLRMWICIGKSVGKVFEENWKKSCPDYIFIYRPPDAAQSFNLSSTLRFSQKSPCDYFMFNGKFLFCLEFKTVAGTSISFERDKNDKGVIHWYQIDTLKKFSEYKNIIAGLIVDFRKSGNTYFLNIKEWDNLVSHINKKSFNENDLTEYSNPILVEKRKLKVNYRYNIEKFLEEVKP